MLRFIILRLIGMVAVLWIVSLVTFAIFYMAPTLSHTNPIYYFMGRVPYKPGSPQLAALEHQYGFDLPVYQQYWNWLTHIFTGTTYGTGNGEVFTCHAPCLGYSFKLHDTVTHLIVLALPVSISICVGAAILWLIGGVLIGTVSALKPRSVADRAGMLSSLVAISLPIFFTGPLLLLIFEYKLHWLSNPEYTPITQDPAAWFRSMILPWICLAFLYAAMYARMTRSNMLETLSEDYMRTARSKGLRRRKVVVKHGLRAALTPVATIFAMDVAMLFGTTVITEQIFNFRGLGWLALTGINSQDLPVIMGVTLVAALVIVVCNVLVDILYAVIDPRVRL